MEKGVDAIDTALLLFNTAAIVIATTCIVLSIVILYQKSRRPVHKVIA